MKNRDYIITLDNLGRNVRNTLLHMSGCHHPTKGVEPGTTIWWRDIDDAIRYNKIGSKEKQFSPEPGCLETWLGTLVCKGFSHVSIRPEWEEYWEKRRPIGPWIPKLLWGMRTHFTDVEWRLYRDGDTNWWHAVDIRFDSEIPIETHFDYRPCRYSEWDEPVFGRPSKLEVLRAVAEKRRAEKAASAN